jgi:WD40 repeat protein
VSSLAVNGDETTLAAGTGLGTAWTVDVDTGAVRTTLSGQPVAVRGLAFREGEAPLVSSSADGRLRTWADRSTQRVLRRLPGGREGLQEAISPLLLHASGDAHLILDPATGRVQRQVPRIASRDDGPIFSPNLTSYLVYTALLQDPETLAIHDVNSGRVRRTRLPEGAVPARAGFSPALADDGRLAVVSYTQGAIEAAGEVLSADGSSRVELEPFEIRCAVSPYFSLDGALLATRDSCGAVTFHDAASGRLIRQVRVDERGGYLLWMPDGRVLVDGARGTVHVVDPLAGTARALREHDDAIDNLATSSDGRWLAAMDAQDTVSVWDARTLRLVRQHVMQTPPSNIAFSDDSRSLAVIDGEGFIHVWDVCDICRNADALLEQTRKNSSRSLTTAERTTYGVDL